jgi:hypothetical protein
MDNKIVNHVTSSICQLIYGIINATSALSQVAIFYCGRENMD